MGPISRNIGRLSQALPRGDLAGEIPAQWMDVGVIATVTAGAAADGNALVTVTWQGSTSACAYPSTYTPVVGHRVLLAIQPPQIVILCRLIGTPTA